MILTNLTDNGIEEDRTKLYEYMNDIEKTNSFDIWLSALIKNIDRINYWIEVLHFKGKELILIIGFNKERTHYIILNPHKKTKKY